MDLQRNILNTVAYYDILSFPLTSFEIWKYLTVTDGNAGEKDKCYLGDIFASLEKNELKKQIEEFEGFYFLKGRKDLVDNRIQNDKNSIEKYKIAKRVTWWLRFVPFIRMIAVTGTLAMKNCEKDSDIDFFVVLEKGRIFTGRLLVTLVVHLLGKRRYEKYVKNRICLNYFVTTGSLKIKRKDLFAANEYSFIYPLFSSLPHYGRRSDVYKQFREENADWIKKYKPNFDLQEMKPARYFSQHRPVSRAIQKINEDLINSLFGDRIEAWLKKKQIVRIGRNPLTKKEGSYVEANDENLIFLPDPQGPKKWGKYKALTAKNNFL